MPYTGHVRKRTTKSGITTYQVIVEEESSFANGKRKRYYKTIQGGKKQAEKVMRDMIHELKPELLSKTIGSRFGISCTSGWRST